MTKVFNATDDEAMWSVVMVNCGRQALSYKARQATLRRVACATAVPSPRRPNRPLAWLRARQMYYLCQNPGPTYVSAGEEALPAVLGAMAVVYAVLTAVWVGMLIYKRCGAARTVDGRTRWRADAAVAALWPCRAAVQGRARAVAPLAHGVHGVHQDRHHGARVGAWRRRGSTSPDALHSPTRIRLEQPRRTTDEVPDDQDRVGCARLGH